MSYLKFTVFWIIALGAFAGDIVLPEVPAGIEFPTQDELEGNVCPPTVRENYLTSLEELINAEMENNGFIAPPSYETYCLREPDYAARDRQQSDDLTEYFARVFNKRAQVAQSVINAGRSMALCGLLSENEWLVISDRLNNLFQKYITEGMTHFNGGMRTSYNRFIPFMASASYVNKFISISNMPLADSNTAALNGLYSKYYNELLHQVRIDHELRYRPKDFVRMLRTIEAMGGATGFDLQSKLVELGKALSFELYVQNKASFTSSPKMNYVTEIKNHAFSYTFFAPNTGDFVPWMQTNYKAIIYFDKAEIIDEDMTGRLISPLSIFTQFKFSYDSCQKSGDNAYVYLEKFGASTETYEFHSDEDVFNESVPSFLDSWSKSTFSLNRLAVFQRARNNLDSTDFNSLMFESRLINLNPKVYDDIYEGRMPGLPMKARLKVDLYHTPK